MLHNCLVAADEVVIPITADRFAIQGISELSTTIQAIKKRQNTKLNIAGILLCNLKKEYFHKILLNLQF